MIHASVRAVGDVAGGPDQIHLALKDVVTERGTLMMYVSCPQFYDEVGRGHLTAAQEQEVLEKLPPFDPLTARSARDNGAPGLRPHYHPHYYGAFAIDPDGHNIEAVCHLPADTDA